ncbi:AAA family ATPase [Burkholderia gladioli]|uniref:AAA family ATPase n=1 Tax=Burkholderia gladioli TaxID=28095 RepID=UPI00163F07C4|nr:AAA family ATPase [Burkholderia gladioli]
MRTSGAQKPIVERFTLRGVHGYKDISIDFSGAATVIVAENGTGKTTLLSAFNAFLSRRFHRLASLSFVELECKFYEYQSPIIVKRDELLTGQQDLTEMVLTIARDAAVSEDELLEFIVNSYSPENFYQFQNHSLVHQLYVKTPGGIENAKRRLDELHSLYTGSLTNYAKRIISFLHGILENIDIIFLPTYRRIERPMLRTSRKRKGARVHDELYFHSRIEKKEYAYEGIAFGLGDIEARLVELSEEIERTSNYGYRSWSARILSDSLKGKSARPANGTEDLPDIKTLSLFLGRLGPVENNLGEIFKNIGGLYDSGSIYSDEFEFLRYFLTGLNKVISQTKALEQRIEHFVAVCNSYLTMSSDEKKLAFDPQTLTVFVQNSWANCTVPLDELSSGEKQIVSLMAKLYLYDRHKFVLIDEPELSLSISWQRKVLPDVLRSGSVVQLLAITHSPFVFENELDSSATGLKISRTGGAVR